MVTTRDLQSTSEDSSTTRGRFADHTDLGLIEIRTVWGEELVVVVVVVVVVVNGNAVGE